MAKKQDKRFVVTYSQGGFSAPGIKILLDTETGVNYMYAQSGYSGGLTPLLNRDGTPVVTSIPREEQ